MLARKSDVLEVSEAYFPMFTVSKGHSNFKLLKIKDIHTNTIFATTMKKIKLFGLNMCIEVKRKSWSRGLKVEYFDWTNFI